MRLGCYVLGDDPKLIFGVKLAFTDQVLELQRAIKSILSETFKDVNVTNIQLWNVSIPVDFNFKEAISRLNLVDAESLPPDIRLSSVFLDSLNSTHVHVVVKPPPANLQLLCLVHAANMHWKNAFLIDNVKNNNTVYALKNAIKMAKRPVFDGIPANMLTLFSVLMPHDEGRFENVDLESLQPIQPGALLSEIFPRVDKRAVQVIVSYSGQDILTDLIDLRNKYFKNRTTRAPSDEAESKRFASNQTHAHTRIECGRPRPENLPIPFALQFAPFGEFRDMIRGGEPDPAMSLVSLSMALELTAFFPSEEERRVNLLMLLTEALGEPIARTSIPGTTYKSDGGNANPAGDFEPPTSFHVKVKEEITEGSCEASFEAMLYYTEGVRFILTLKDNQAIAWNQTRLPSILIVHAGPNLQVFGATCTSKNPCMEVLSPNLPMFFNMRDIDARRDLALLLTAIKNLHMSVREVYHHPNQFAVSADQIDFPYPRTYNDLISSSEVSFKYVERVDKTRLVFTAVTQNDDRTKIIVKYMRKGYGQAAHEAAAQLGVAPALLGCQSLPGDWWMVILQALPEDYVDYEDAHFPKDAVTRIRWAVNALHEEGFVHGDLRASNVFVGRQGKKWDVQLIDFDWAGKEGKVVYPMNVGCSPEIWRPRLLMDGEAITFEDDLAMVEDIIRSSG